MKLAAEVTETENLFETLANKSPVGICIMQDGKFCYTNPTFQTGTGYREDELLGRDSLELVVPEDREMVSENAIKMLKGEIASPYQFRVTKKDGSIKWATESVVSIQYRGRSAILGNFVDITAHKQNEEQCKLLADHSADIIYRLRAMNEPFVYVSPSVERTLGYTVQEALVLQPKDVLTQESYEIQKRQMLKDLENGVLERTLQLESVHRDGHIVPVEVHASFICDETGQPVEIVGVVRDITERKQQELEYKTIIQTTIDGFWLLDMQGRLLDVNDAYSRLIGYSHNELLMMNISGIEVIEKPEETAARIAKIREFGGDHFETKHKRKDGSIVDVDVSVNYLKVGEGRMIGFIRNITEHKRAEEALRDSEESYRELADSITEVFFAMNEHMRYTYWNKASEILTGVRAEDAIGKSLLEIFPDTPGLRRAEKVYRAVLKTQKSKTFVNDFDINGRQYTFEIGAYPSRDGISVFVRDITERERMEEALRDSEEKLRKMFESVAEGISVIDLNGIITETNQRTAEMHGFASKDELIGRNALELIAPHDRERIAASMQKAIKGETVRAIKYCTLIRADGTEFPGELSTNVIRDTSGKVVAHITIARDITERKEAEEAIKLAAKEWRRTFDSITDAISIHDRDFRIQRANKAFADIFNMKPSQIIGRHCYELHKGQKPISGCPHQQTLATGKPAAAEFYESHLGKYLHESTSPIFNEKGEVVGTVHITRDITEQKQQNERLMMADRLASIGELSSGAAHELNNPLTSIIGFSQLLMEKDISDDIREDVKLIYNEAQRAVNVTKNFLTFARKHTPVKEPNQINNIIEDVLELHAHEHKVNHIHVEKRLAPNLPEILVDYFQMQQVFMNIIINAEYFMIEAHNAGTLTITTKKENSTVRISIADDGPGIPPENLGRIFDPFFTTKEAGRGTGLGLSICHGIVTEHGGQINVRSQLGKGATIFIDIPIRSLTHFKSIL